MADKAKHAYGSRKNLEAAIASGKVDAYDLLFLNGEDESPAIGWVDKNGNPIVIAPNDDLAELETQVEAKIAAKADASEVEALGTEIATKANASEVEAELATKANADEVDEKINTAAENSVAAAKTYTDGKVEAAISEHLVKKYEITSLPEGSLVDYREKEIRVMCPADTKWVKQNVGATGDANCYYATFKTYVFDDTVAGYIEHLGSQVDSEILTTFSTDEYGRRYQTTWLALARYDEATNTWTYYGKTSSVEKYIGWDYQIDWYDANGAMIASDNIRINLSNENCHSIVEPYYVGKMMKEVDEKIAAATDSTIKIVEF